MEIILHGQRHERAQWLCDRGDAGVPGGVSGRGDDADAARSRRMWVQPSGTGQGSLPVAAGVLVPLTSPNSPFDHFSPPDWLLGAGRPFPCGWLFLPVAMAMALGASGPEAGGRGPYLRRSPRAAGTPNPASLHFTPLRSTEELSNDQLGGSEQVLGGVRHCPLLLLTP